jgi:hypothetical protein
MKDALDCFPPRFWKRLFASAYALAFVLLLLLMVGGASGQSTEAEMPTPIRAGDINAAIAVRDLGDPRLTRHFYIFTGVPGDLMISVESKNLDGDVDIFTASGLRPLVKINLYASEVAAKTTKSIYLRARQDLILRVEARSPNEEPGSYRLQFGGSFEPFSGEIASADNPSLEDERPTLGSSRKGKRVSAVGARIDEPPAPIEEKAAAEQPATERPSEPEKTEPVATNAEPARTNRGRRPPARVRPPRAASRKPAATAKVEGPTRDNTETTPAAAPPTERPSLAATQSETGPRLIIETLDGEKIERSMSTVRRVVVDNGQIIVILKTGRIERMPLTNVVRMSIEP